MLRISITILCLAVWICGRSELILPQTYVVVSDVYDETLPEGHCILRGKVVESYSENPVGGGYVSDISQKRFSSVDAAGNYKVKLLASDSAFFFFQPEYGEIICRNYNFKSKHVVTVNFMVGLKRQKPMPVAEKPVIYLYNDKPVEAVLSLTPNGNLTFTYPHYDKNWQVMVQKNGIVADNRVYPYLFWEADLDKLQFSVADGQMEGYFIRTDSTVQFLENTLAALGLNDTEKTDFITYWGPRICKYPYATIQFLVDDAYQSQIAELKVNPQPDTQKRIYMIFEGSHLRLEQNYLKAPTFEPFDRKGFTLIEWGGSELKK